MASDGAAGELSLIPGSQGWLGRCVWAGDVMGIAGCLGPLEGWEVHEYSWMLVSHLYGLVLSD